MQKKKVKAKSLSTVVIIVLAVAFTLGHAYYGWNLYNTLISDADVWTKLLFLAIFVIWLLITTALLVFVVSLWKERRKNHENRKR